MLYVCIIPNHGARIGHQSAEYFFLVRYCQDNGFHYVYHPFTRNSKTIGAFLQFDKIHDIAFTDPFIQSMPRISIRDLSIRPHDDLVKLHNSAENILLFDEICGNEWFIPALPLTRNSVDMMWIRSKYNSFYGNFYPRLVEGPYICIHIRRGDILDTKARYLDTVYFIDKYKYLLGKIEEKDLPVYAITEKNFNDDELLKKEIPGIIIHKGSETEAFQYLINCAYLVASRSGFSNLAHVLGNMKVVIPPGWRFMPHNNI